MKSTLFSLNTHGARATDAHGLVKCYDIHLRSAPSDPEVSIVIPIYNQLTYTLKCLHSIAKWYQQTTYEVIVVDDCSDMSVFRALHDITNLNVLRNFTNLGFVQSCNRGAYHAKGKYVVMLNNDTEVGDGWLDHLMSVFKERPDAGLVGAKLVYPDGTLQEAGGIIWSDGSGWNYGRNDDPSLPWYNYVKEVDYCSGACIMLKKALWDQLGGFDLKYVPAYCEDSDLAFRVREAGYKVYYQPRSEIIHHEGKSNGVDTGEGLKKYQVINHSKLMERWGSQLAANQRPNAVDVFKVHDRSLHKPCILFIDHYLPQFDKDAGSRTMWAYVCFFVNQGFSVKFIGDNYCPHEPYQTLMQQMGVEVLTGLWMSDNWEAWLENNGRYIDYVMLSRAHVVGRYLPPLKKFTKAKLLFYGHDLISRTARNMHEFSKDPAKLKEATEAAALELEVFKQSDAIYYPSELEIEELKRVHPGINARALPPYVFDEPSKCPAPTPEEIERRTGIMFVGGFIHTPNVQAMVWFCKEVLPIVHRSIPGLKLTIAGSNPPASVKGLASESVRVTGFISDDELSTIYKCSRIVVVPLLTGGGIKGKVIEALWHAVPVLTTPVGSEGIPRAEEVMKVVKPESMAESLISLYNDYKRLSKMSFDGIDVIKQFYSNDALKNVLSKDVQLS